MTNNATPSDSPSPNTTPEQAQFTTLMDSARILMDKRSLEASLQSYNSALHLCDSHPPLTNRKYEVLGNIGWINRLSGRYTTAISLLQEALDLSAHLPPARPRIQIAGELGNVYRLTGRNDEAKNAFNEQFTLAKEMGLTGPMCRAVGNLGAVNYSLGWNAWQQGGNKEEGRKLIDLAMDQFRERVRLALVIQDEEDGKQSHGATVRERQARGWEAIGYSRLSLCFMTLAEMEPDSKEIRLEEAEVLAEKAVDTVDYWYDGALPLARYFHARALLLRGKREEAMVQLNPKPRWDFELGVTTPAIGMCKEPSVEHRGYLREIVGLGVDLSITDDEGYTALDYAVFNGDRETEEIVIEGLRASGLSEDEVERQRREAVIRKGYREVLQEKLRPILYKKDPDCVRQLRRAYAETLAADPEKSAAFDRLSFIPFLDFSRFGRLPRSSDGLVKEFKLGENGEDDNVEFLIFFSYRWINTDRSLNTPDDADNTQYHRMLDAIDWFLVQNPQVDREKLCIWMDFACVDQDDPAKGVTALPIIITQCDVVISLDGPDYYERAWCCVEVAMITALRWNDFHQWYEHKAAEDGGWSLEKSPRYVHVEMKDKKLTFEGDREKVLFLARQSKLLRHSV
ncbi:hypothetical protein OQA88_5413 [Cercophora sp. LCS_1]